MRSLVIAVLLIGVLSVFLINNQAPTTHINVIKSNCYFEKGVCQLELNENQFVNFELLPLGLPSMEPLTLTITGLSQAMEISGTIKVWFEGRDMFMGQHFMLPVEEKDHNTHSSALGQLVFKGMIPVCSVDESMVWRLIVELPEAQTTKQVHFELQSGAG